MKTRYTKPVMEECISCGKTFRTYIPGSSCLMPDGGIICHEEPMSECPDCDFNGIGVALNGDLFPHLVVN